MYSFIIPSTNKKKIEVPGELIRIYGAKSMFDAWKKGIKKAKHEKIVLMHEDVKVIKIPKLDWKYDMYGVAGTTVIHRDQPWWFSKERYMGWLLSGKIKHNGELSDFGEYGEVVVLDGAFLLTTKTKLLKAIPDIDWAKWDFYDHVISLEYIKRGWKLATAPIEIDHASKGENKRPEFVEDMIKFRNTYLTKTYRVIQ